MEDNQQFFLFVFQCKKDRINVGHKSKEEVLALADKKTKDL